MADHGNDPTIGHSHHTREVGASGWLSARDESLRSGVRTTLSDVGATVCEFFRAPPPQMVALFFPPSGLQETPYEF